jgi:hypothetical protein
MKTSPANPKLSMAEDQVLNDIEKKYQALEEVIMNDPAIMRTDLQTDALNLLNKYNSLIRKLRKSMMD